MRDHRAALDARPWDPAVRVGLEACRRRVAYPDPPEPALRLRPDPPAGLRHRVGPLDLLLGSAAGSLLLGVGLAARWSVRPGWAGPATSVGGLLLAGVAGAGYAARPPPADWQVLAIPSALRAGNGVSYPARAGLPAGAEVRERHRRGGWVRVEVAGGAQGWVPADVLLGPAGDVP